VHITITGSLGSGKSSVSKYISENFNLVRYSTGDVQRELAKQLGMTTLEFNLFCQQQDDAAYDHMIDDKVVRIATEHQDDNIIFDSRMAWHFVPHSFKVFLWVDPEVAARRVFEDDKRGGVESYSSLEEASQKLKARALSESERFYTFYGVRYTDLGHFDLVIDTSQASIPEIAEIIIASSQLHEAGKFSVKTGVIRNPGEFH